MATAPFPNVHESSRSVDNVCGTVSYNIGADRYGVLIAHDADRFGSEFSGFLGGDYEEMVAFLNTAAESGGITSGFDLVDFILEEGSPLNDLLTEGQLDAVPTNHHWFINSDGSVALL